jgi:ZIP family zinc transporter
MNEVTLLILLTLAAGLAMPVGALLASVERIHSKWLESEFRHAVIAFGGGALLSAVALVLVPEGSENLSPGWVALFFALGGVTFMALDRYLAWLNTSVSQLVAMLADFIPEALALGAAVATGSKTATILAGLMALQNLPEGFNSFRELKESSTFKARTIIAAFTAMALAGPVSGLLGYYWLSRHPFAVGAVMLFAAGGILYIIFQDIAPQSKLRRHWAPPLGAVAGFLLGLIGEMIVRG